MCIFVFDPELYPEQIPTSEKISCPYPSINGFDFCIFHLLPTQRDLLFPNQHYRHREYLRAILSVGQIKIVCTTIDGVDLSTVVRYLDSRSNIEIVCSTVTGDLNVSNTSIGNGMYIVNCNIRNVHLRDTSVQDRFRVINSNIEKIIATNSEFFNAATFENSIFAEASFVPTEFNSSVNFCSNLPDDIPIRDVPDILGGESCHFLKTPEFTGATFNQGAIFAGVKFHQAALFSFNEFLGGTSFHKAEFGVGADFNNTRFVGLADFSQTKIGITSFPHCSFEGITHFDGATVGNEYTELMLSTNNRTKHRLAEGIDTDIINRIHRSKENEFIKYQIDEMDDWGVVFDYSDSEGLLFMNDLNLKGGLKMSDCSLSHLEIGLQSSMTQTGAILNESNIQDGSLKVLSKNCFYELRDATIGPIDISAPDSVGLFDNIYVDNTNFSGFEFSNFREELHAIDWKIDGAVFKQEHFPPVKRETTYSKAKSGASLLGDRLAESKFFILERRYRRKRYLDQARENNDWRKRVLACYRAIINTTYDWLCEYGESPRRVISWSIVTVFLFSFIYNYYSVYDGLEYSLSVEDPITGIIWTYDLRNIIVSLQSFSSFLIGDAPVGIAPSISLISSFQSFIGAFAIALFVATIVRRIER